MKVNKDYKDLLLCLNAEKAEFMIVGAYALMFYSEPRFTGDIDIWVNNTHENAEKVYRALIRFGAPLGNTKVEDFTDDDLVYQIGIAPNRIDILMGIDGVTFDEAWPLKTAGSYDTVPVMIIGKNELIRNKLKTGRKKDLLDVDNLNELSSDNDEAL